MQINNCPLCNNPPDSGKQFGKILTIWCSTCGLEIAQGGTSDEEIVNRWNSLRSNKACTRHAPARPKAGNQPMKLSHFRRRVRVTQTVGQLLA